MEPGQPPQPPGVVSLQPGYGPPTVPPGHQGGPITIQPGAQMMMPQGPIGQTAIWMPMPESIPGVPPGLEYLTYVDSIIVYQLKELIELVTSWETKNKYVLKNANGEQVYYAFEESACCERQCCGPARGFTMHIVDNFKREVLTLRRPFKCCGGGCCGLTACIGCCQQECTVETPSGFLGTIQQRQSCCSSSFHLLDADGNEILKIDGPCCCLMCGCQDKEFPVNTMSGQNIGAITKKWGGCFREAFTDADVFRVNFPLDMDVKMKAIMLGATFLIDFMEFEQPNQNKNN